MLNVVYFFVVLEPGVSTGH